MLLMIPAFFKKKPEVIIYIAVKYDNPASEFMCLQTETECVVDLVSEGQQNILNEC